MRKFLRKVALFALLVALLLGVGELIVRSLETPYRYKAERLRADGERVSTLVLGSSHMYYGVEPSLLGDSAFNLANISQTPEYDLALLREFRPYMKNLRRVILPISYFTFRDPTMEEFDRGLCVQYKVGMGLPLHSDFSVYNLALTDFDSYAGRLRNLIAPQELNLCDSLGFGLGFDLAHRGPNWKERAADRAKALTQERPGRADEVERVLEETVDYCREQGLEVVFVTTPVWSGFRAEMDAGQYREMREKIAALQTNTGVRYLDFFASDLFTDDDFHDVDHLSDLGAAKLTRLLRASLLTQSSRPAR